MYFSKSSSSTFFFRAPSFTPAARFRACKHSVFQEQNQQGDLWIFNRGSVLRTSTVLLTALQAADWRCHASTTREACARTAMKGRTSTFSIVMRCFQGQCKAGHKNISRALVGHCRHLYASINVSGWPVGKTLGCTHQSNNSK